MREFQAWPEVIYARACYDDLSGYDSEHMPWETLNWRNPSQSMVSVTFTSSGTAGSPGIIDWPELTMAGDDIVIRVTLGSHANEAHANLDRDRWGWMEDLVLDGWVGWTPDPDSTTTGTIRIPTDQAGPGYYMLYVDNSGEGYENARSQERIRIVENPYQSGSALKLPDDLTEIGEEAFEGINADAIIIPEGVTSIGRRAFAGSGARLAVIPESAGTIGEGAFAGCNIEMVYGYSYGGVAESLAEELDAEFCLIH
jgi:hypothetical protein